jgi:hypothetical protein
MLTTPLLERPDLLRAAQYGIVAFEAASPLMLVRGYIGRIYVVVAALFQLVVYATIRLTFLPHVVCLLAFVPLERIVVRSRSLAHLSSGRGAPNVAPGRGARNA